MADVHRPLSELGHHEHGCEALPLSMCHNGQVGWPCLEVLAWIEWEGIAAQCVA